MAGPINGVNPFSDSLIPVHVTDNGLHINNYVWDTATLSWVRATQSTSGGTSSDVFITNTSLPVTGPLTDAQLRASPVNTSPAEYTKRFDKVDEIVSYFGEASPGSDSSSASWKIKKISVQASGDLEILYADGNANFDNVWDNRAFLTYL